VTSRQQWTTVAGIVAALAIAFLVADHFVGREFALVGIGSHAPDFRAATMDGVPGQAAHVKTIGDYRGDVVLLNIWATWCAPCRVEMPSIETLQRTFGPRGLHIVAISVDGQDADSTIRSFVKQYGLTFEILHDPTVPPLLADGDRLPGAIERAYQTTGVPETFVIARDGVIRKKWIGAADWSSPGNQALINQLLQEPSS
jgi:cytochrome c biogenesis protein CcmG/thiol:disulfide interchange protein DsbE